MWFFFLSSWMLVLLSLAGCAGVPDTGTAGEPCTNASTGTSGEPDTGTSGQPENSFTVLVYNIHAGRDAAGMPSLDRIISVLESSGAEIIALNEVDRNFGPRSNYQDQLQLIAEALEMDFVFQKTTWKSPVPASGDKPREFGHAILTSYPVEIIHASLFDDYNKHYHGLLGAGIELNGQRIRVFVTHLDTDSGARADQLVQLEERIGNSSLPTLLMGDLNATPDDPGIAGIREGMADAFEGQPEAYTYKTGNPAKRIDYILGTGVSFENSSVISTPASDHLPIITEVNINQ